MSSQSPTIAIVDSTTTPGKILAPNCVKNILLKLGWLSTVNPNIPICGNSRALAQGECQSELGLGRLDCAEY
jgi:hypothetical protein